MLPVQFIFSQQKEEYKLQHAIEKEKSEAKKFSRLLALGEFYENHNIYKADSISHLILKKSRNLSSIMKFKALLFSLKIAEIQGNQEDFFNDILGLEP